MSLPKPYTDFKENFPGVAETLEKLGDQCQEAGPLDQRSSHLVKLGVAIALLSRGAVKSQARRALKDGFSVEEVRHAALLALPTIGFPSMIAALGWINEVAGELA